MNKHRVAIPSVRKGERGSVLAYTVLSVLFLFLAVGLGADLSHLYLVKNELQNAADASALAGASALLLPQDQRIPTAVQRAVAVMNKNKYNFNNKEFSEVMALEEQETLIEFAVNLDGPYYDKDTAAEMENIRFVRVQTPPVPVNIFFSIPILGTSRTLTAWATSGLSVQSNVFCNYVPIAVVEGASGEGIGWDSSQPCDPPPDAPECNPATAFCPGCKYKMIAGPGNWQDTSPGNYQALDAGAGAKDLKLAIAGGTSNCITSNDQAVFETETEPGRITGPIEKGLNTRFDVYQAFGNPNVIINGESKRIEEAFPPDPNIYEGPDPLPKDKNTYVYPGITNNEYLNAVNPTLNWKSPDHDPTPHRREIFMPIINQNEFEPGKDTVKFTRVGKFFMNKKVDGNNAIYVEYIGPALGAGGYDPEGGNIAPVVVPVLYR